MPRSKVPDSIFGYPVAFDCPADEACEVWLIVNTIDESAWSSDKRFARMAEMLNNDELGLAAFSSEEMAWRQAAETGCRLGIEVVQVQATKEREDRGDS